MFVHSALFDFQARLTGEKVVLDIGSVRMVTINKANVLTNTQYSSARLQIWHEAEGRWNAQSDVASFVTAGTALSGPLRERVTVGSSRLMLYLGRTEEYITLFSTLRPYLTLANSLRATIEIWGPCN